MKKISSVLLRLFAIGVLVTLFAGALSLVGYLVAFVIGGETATKLCTFIYKEYFPVVIQICSVSVLFGLIGMYLKKEKALTFSEEKEEQKK